MQATTKNLSDTKVQLTIVADKSDIEPVKEQVLRELAKEVKIQGFRPGKAPLNMVEKNVDPGKLQAEVLERGLNVFYVQAIRENNVHVVAQPEVKITKFVPFDTLEAEATVEAVGKITLADYKKIKLPKEKTAVTTKEIEEVLQELKTREAEKKDVTRAAKKGDQVWIDFKGVDAKTKEPIQGADGKEYPLNLGSDTFIPGFEDNLIGVKPGEQKEFTLTFPKDYGVKTLQSREVTFNVTATKVQEVIEPKVDDTLAAKVGPFKTVADLKADIKKELQARKQNAADQKYADDLVMKIAEQTKVAIPATLIDEQIERMEQSERQNAVYRGQTWKEYLEAQDLTEESYRKKIRPDAELRVKAGITLAEIAEAEKISVDHKEIDSQLELLKQQYPDPKMRAELDKPEARRDIASRMVTQKTIQKLNEYAQAA